MNQSILQLKLGSLAIKISYIGMIAAAFTFLILCIRLFIEELGIKKLPWTNTYFKYILSYLVQGVTVVVVAVPEGLPLAVALALSFAVRVNIMILK
jgi:magnesium-transporting ATPase (P-type)